MQEVKVREKSERGQRSPDISASLLGHNTGASVNEKGSFKTVYCIFKYYFRVFQNVLNRITKILCLPVPF